MLGVQILLLAFFIGSALTLRENFVRIGKFDYLVSEQKLNWFRAAHYCHSIDADLASIESSAELLAISGYLKGKGKGSEDWFWFDGNELGEHGQWYSLTTGRLMAFIQWTKTEPNMLDNAEHCICLWKEVNEFEMSDWGCENPAYFICKARPQVETLGRNRTKIAAGAGADTFSSLKEQLDKERKVNFTEIEDQFYFIGDTAVSWHEADQLCRRHDANLANIESHSELAAIGKFLLKKGDWAFWIDGIDAERKGVIISLTNGKPLSFMDFDSWQPYRGLGNCVMIWSYDGIFKMYENSCESKALYVCKAKEPEVVIVYGSPVGFLE